MEGSGCSGQWRRRRPDGGDDGGRSEGRRLGETRQTKRRGKGGKEERLELHGGR
ncbi:hypothetical protein RHGRI_009623 [Rhododendron griersonianum]|uniref:Uncharacterized protein n=1 Tax=Rhododendron griersonianum TaxID=479676 RepID=A0AAV6KFE7_9ERIC|nr:hypothetical protein RHGRI_009623 [Rhododendron griersonianum]